MSRERDFIIYRVFTYKYLFYIYIVYVCVCMCVVIVIYIYIITFCITYFLYYIFVLHIYILLCYSYIYYTIYFITQTYLHGYFMFFIICSLIVCNVTEGGWKWHRNEQIYFDCIVFVFSTFSFPLWNILSSRKLTYNYCMLALFRIKFWPQSFIFILLSSRE